MTGFGRLATGLKGGFQRILAETRRENWRNSRYWPEGAPWLLASCLRWVVAD